MHDATDFKTSKSNLKEMRDQSNYKVKRELFMNDLRLS